ncbi:hypothetical protein JCM6882_000690 [Rhodosporidiobolus microsporus]
MAKKGKTDDSSAHTLNSSQSQGHDDATPHIQRLPDELICTIAKFYNPSIPFELGHFVLAGDYRRQGRNELRALAATCKRFAKILRPTVYRNLVFQDDRRRSNTVQLYKAKDVHEHVKELYWQPSYLYNDMSPIFLPLLRNLKYLILAFLPQSVPDEFISDDYAGVTTLRTSFTDALRQLPNLEALEIPFWEKQEDETFVFCEALPKLNSVSIGDWQEWEAFGDTSKLTTVKWLIHPDLDHEEGVIEGFVERMMPNAKVLQFAAHSGWGRTDLPEKLPNVLREASWFKDMSDSPLESMTYHGFNPITSFKPEWATLLPSFLSLLADAPRLSHVTFLDVPSIRNDDRSPLDWDDVRKLEQVRELQVTLATEEEMRLGGAAGEGEGGGGEEGGARQEQHDGAGREAEDKNHPELSERISPEDIYTLLSVFPNIRHLTLANFLRCEKPREHSRGQGGARGGDDDGDETETFAEEHFQPAARDFIRELGLYDRFQKLEQVVFRSVEAELAVRFRRTQEGETGADTRRSVEGDGEGEGENEPGEGGWVEELRRLY